MKIDSNKLAKIAYAAYGGVTDGKNYQGLPMPAWEELGDQIQFAWVAAVLAVAGELKQTGGPGESSAKAPMPTIGRIVHYTLTDHDAQAIATKFPQMVDGVQVRNSASAGDVFPAVIVRAWPGDVAVNLKVMLDGYAEHWVTSRSEGQHSGSWSWPPRV
jgi:hypothetical protein